MLTVRKRRTIVVDFCRPRQTRRKTPLAVVWVLAGMLASTMWLIWASSARATILGRLAYGSQQVLLGGVQGGPDQRQ